MDAFELIKRFLPLGSMHMDPPDGQRILLETKWT